jgi:hypothetical protein
MLVECFRLAAAYRFLPDDAPPGIVFDQVKEAAAIGGPHRIALPSLGSGQGRACAGLKVVDPDPLGRVALHDGEARFVRRKGQLTYEPGSPTVPTTLPWRSCHRRRQMGTEVLLLRQAMSPPFAATSKAE